MARSRGSKPTTAKVTPSAGAACTPANFVIAGVIVAAALAYWSGQAFGAEMPKELWGYWCGRTKGDGWVRCSDKTWDGMCCVIDRRGAHSEETECKVLNVRRVDDYTWIIKERCAYGSVDTKKDPDADDAEIKMSRYKRKGVYLDITDTK